MPVFIIFIMNILLSTTQTDSTVMIRVSNNTHYVLNQVQFNSPPCGLVYFGKLKSNEKSDYVKVKGAYPTAAIVAFADNIRIDFLPDDYLGEQLLQPGKYTYEISIIESSSVKYLRIKFIVDKD